MIFGKTSTKKKNLICLFISEYLLECCFFISVVILIYEYVNPNNTQKSTIETYKFKYLYHYFKMYRITKSIILDNTTIVHAIQNMYLSFFSYLFNRMPQQPCLSISIYVKSLFFYYSMISDIISHSYICIKQMILVRHIHMSLNK